MSVIFAPAPDCKPAIGIGLDRRLLIFARGTDQALWYSIQRAPGGGWAPWASLGGGFLGSPAVGRNADGRHVVFVRGGDNLIYFQEQVLTGGAFVWPKQWQAVAGAILSDPALGSSAGQLTLAARGTDNFLYQWNQISSNGGWSSWKALGAPSSSGIMGNTTLLSMDDGRLALFTRDSAGVLFEVLEHGGAAKWSSLGGVLTSDPYAGATPDGRQLVLARGTDNKLYYRQQTAFNGPWAAWVGLDQVATSAPALGRNADGRLLACARGTDQALWCAFQATPGGNWQPFASLGGRLAGDPGVGQNADGSLVVIALGTTNAYYYNQQLQPNGAWGEWKPLGTGMRV